MKLFIDCGVNRGQSIWAFSEYMQGDNSWDYIGFEPAIGGLNSNSMQVNEMRKNLKKWGERYNSVKLIPKAVGSKDIIKIFWWSYGAGSTWLFSMAIRMFFRDLLNFKFKKSLRFLGLILLGIAILLNLLKIRKIKDIMFLLN